MKKVIMILLIGILIFGLVGCGSSEKTEEEKKKDKQTEIITAAQQIVKENLKSPKSASFPWSYDEYKIEEGTSDREGYKRYTVSCYVDAENSFGAEIRNNFKVELDLAEDGTSFYKIDCVIN